MEMFGHISLRNQHVRFFSTLYVRTVRMNPKLNIAFFNGALLASAIIGGMTESWTVFFVVLGVAVAIAIAVYGNNIRMRRE